MPILLLKVAYATFMVATGRQLLLGANTDATTTEAAKSLGLNDASVSNFPAVDDTLMREMVDSDGKTYLYRAPEVTAEGAAAVAAGGALCGLLGVGVGEVVLPRLLRGGLGDGRGEGMPVPVAAGTSILVVVVAVAAAAGEQWGQLLAAGGARAVPWNLVLWQWPGVILGAQAAAFFQVTLHYPVS